ncbi:MAG: hypothetical protein ABR601_00865 [Parasphingopyxis sp.]
MAAIGIWQTTTLPAQTPTLAPDADSPGATQTDPADRLTNLTGFDLARQSNGANQRSNGDGDLPLAPQPRLVFLSDRPIDAHTQARLLAGTGLSAGLDPDESDLAEIDLQLGDEAGPRLTGSFGLSSQPRELDPSNVFFLRGQTVREDRAVANIGIEF